jgi:hypothetical protein
MLVCSEGDVRGGLSFTTGGGKGKLADSLNYKFKPQSNRPNR